MRSKLKQIMNNAFGRLREAKFKNHGILLAEENHFTHACKFGNSYQAAMSNVRQKGQSSSFERRHNHKTPLEF